MGRMKKTKDKSLEAQLEKVYCERYQAITGVTAPMAKKFIKMLLVQTIKESKRAGTYSLTPDYGQKLIESAETDESVKEMLEKKRADGVTDDDIRRWWAISDLERRLLLKIDETNRVGLFLKFINFDKISRDEANTMVIKYHPVYGDPEDTSQWEGEDRPIPPELRERVNHYVQQQQSLPLEEQQKKLEAFSSLNARIRHEIKEGTI
ncbi:MAG: hypothetical protein AB9903_12210 [Vulcanimicrobiota bacterium]